MTDEQMRLEALKLVIEVWRLTGVQDSVVDAAAHYYAFLKGDTAPAPQRGAPQCDKPIYSDDPRVAPNAKLRDLKGWLYALQMASPTGSPDCKAISRVLAKVNELIAT